ncbi:MAG TPA: GAF domain-containing protein, partial [Vicinamibacteria bacterium]|nr:GAF domain-containing protein [Vicinamibacteria bacterium]
AAIRKAQLLEKVRRYAALMERVVSVDEAVFAGRTPAEVSRIILDGALRIGSYAGGVLVLEGDGGTRVAARSEGAGESDRPVPPALLTRTARRLDAEQSASVAPSVGLDRQPLFLVPLATPDVHVGTLVLADPDGESDDDRLMEAYASRAAAAWVFALRHGPSRS